MKWFFFRDWPLRLKVLVVLFVASTLPLIVAGFMASDAMRREEREKTKEILKARGDEVAALLDAFHHSYQVPARRLAALPEIIHFAEADPAERPAIRGTVLNHLERWQESDRSFRSLSVLDRTGKLILAKGELSFRPEIYERACIEKGLVAPLITELRLDPDSDFSPKKAAKGEDPKKLWEDLKKHKPTIGYLHPVRGKNGKVVGLVALWVDATGMWDILWKRHQMAGKNSYISLFDQTGVRIGHSFNATLPFYPGGDVDAEDVQTMVAERRFGKHTAKFFEKDSIKYFDEQFRRARDPAEPDREVFTGFARANYKWNMGTARRLETKEAPWTLFYMVPLETVEAPLAAISWQVLFASGGLILLALVTGFFLARAVLKPIGVLGKAMEDLGVGRLDARVPANSADELGRLGAGFNRMAGQLQTTVQGLNERQARIVAIMDTVADGILTVTEQGTIESVNNAALRIFGHERPEQIVGRSLSTLLPGADEAFLRNASAASPDAPDRSREMAGQRPDGSTVPLAVAVGKVHVGELHLLTVTFHDLTTWKRAEQELVQAKSRAENAIVSRDIFLAQVSHELRTPLNHILGFCQLLELGPLTESQQRDLDRIHRAGNHLQSLIEDILDYQKIIMGQIAIDRESFDAAASVREIAESMESKVREKSNRLEVRCDAGLGALYADRKRFRQILINLLSNAAKFTRQGTIAVRARRQAAAGGEWIVVSVTDSGIGIAPENLNKLFKPFSQISGTAENPEGTGLGLAICKVLCERMGGEIGVTSVPGQGSTFAFRLPAAVAGATTATPASRRRKTAVLPAIRPDRPCTVLVIDDDPQVGEFMKRFLEKQGFAVYLSLSGVQALEIVKNLRPDVITLDVLMPGIDGWSVLAALKNDAEIADIPVVMLSIVDDRSKGFLLGANEYVTKPVDWDRLAGVLRKYRTPLAGDILVVDDDPRWRELCRRALEPRGWQVVEAEDGASALRRVREQRPGLILLDLMLPVMDGFEFLEKLHSLPNQQDTIVVVMTAKELTDEERRRLNGRVQDILEKGRRGLAEVFEDILRDVKRFMPRVPHERAKEAKACQGAPGGK